jgi:hypothetical protein
MLLLTSGKPITEVLLSSLLIDGSAPKLLNPHVRPPLTMILTSLSPLADPNCCEHPAPGVPVAVLDGCRCSLGPLPTHCVPCSLLKYIAG